MDIKKEMQLDVNRMYPTVSLASINPERIKSIRDQLLSDGSNTEIFVIEYKGYYLIVKGHHHLLAASNLGINRVKAYLVDYHDLSFFSDPSNIEKTLSDIGLSTLYDFEAAGGITYPEYPSLYTTGDSIIN